MKRIFALSNYTPQFTYVIVTKRINTRFFRVQGSNQINNPPSGTVVDDVVTLPEVTDN